MKFLDTEIINAFRCKHPKVLRIKSWHNNKIWSKLIERHADELPRFEVEKEVRIDANGLVVLGSKTSIKFDESINRRNFFKKIIVEVHDGLVWKIIKWAEKEPIIADMIEFQILGEFHIWE